MAIMLYNHYLFFISLKKYAESGTLHNGYYYIYFFGMRIFIILGCG